MYEQLLYQRTMIEMESKQVLDYIETLFSAYVEVFLVLSVIVLVSILWLCASELKITSRRARANNNSYLSSFSSTC